MTKGISCPTCGSTLNHVLETRARKGEITRKRRCFNEHTFTTEEKLSNTSPKPAEDERLDAAQVSHLIAQHKAQPKGARTLPGYVSFADLSRRTGIPTSTLFRLAAGKSPGYLRMRDAKHEAAVLLQQGQTALQDIAAKVGLHRKTVSSLRNTEAFRNRLK